MSQIGRQALRSTIDQTMRLGRAIEAARVLKGWEKEDLADQLGRSRSWVSRLEDGHVGLSAFEYARISSLLGIPPQVIEEIAWRGIQRREPPPER